MFVMNPTTLRFVTHKDISCEDVKLAIEKLKYVVDSEENFQPKILN